MRKPPILLASRLWALLMALALMLLSGSSCRQAAETCAQCERSECKNLAFTVELTGGKTIETCCARCGLHYLESEHPEVSGLTARDFDTSARLDATRAFFVEGSDVTPCVSMNARFPSDERGCCLSPVYDRCLPSLIAFSSRRRAGEFASVHGGSVKTLEEIGASVRHENLGAS